MMKLVQRSTKIFFLFWLLITAFTILLHPSHKVEAAGSFSGDPEIFTNVSPPRGGGRFNPTCVTASNACYTSGTSITPYYVIGNNLSDYTYAYMTTAVYVKKGTGPVTITIKNAAPDCHSVSADNLVGPDYDKGSAPPTEYVLYGNNGMLFAKTSTGGGCLATVSFTVGSGEAKDMATPTNHFDGYFNVIADILPGGPNQGENSYRVKVSSEAIGAGYIGGENIVGLGYRDTNINNGNYWNSWTAFGVPLTCNDINGGTSFPATISYQDSDSNRPDWNKEMIFDLQQQKVNADGTVTGNDWVTVVDESGKVSRAVQGVDMTQNGQLYKGNLPRNYRFRVVLANVGVRNTIRLSMSKGLEGVYANLSERPSTTSGCKTPLPPKDDATCDITASPTGSYTPGQDVTLTITAHNTAPPPPDGTTWQPASYLLKQTGPSPHNVSNVHNPIAPGVSDTFTETVKAPGAGNTTRFTYRMYKDSGATPFGTSCFKDIGTGTKSGAFTVDCKNTKVGPLTSDANYNHATTTTTTTPKATIIPIHIQFFDSSGKKVDEKYDKLSNPGSRTYDTFTDPNFKDLWPHLAYTATLEAQLTGSLGDDKQNGPYTYSPVASDTLLADCLQPGECTPTSGIDLEPRESHDFVTKVGFINNTNKTFPANKSDAYNFHVYISGDIAYVGNQPPNATDINPGSTTVNVTFRLQVNSQGSYWVDFRYKDSAVVFSSNPCGTITLKSSTRPYFKSFGGDISAGGTFASSDGQCNGPISYGSILAYAVPTATTYNGNGGPGPKGASADFGAYALGLIEGRESGYYGFYNSAAINGASYKTLSFANIGGGLGTALYGGYMAGDASNSQTPSPGAGHCVVDYFDNASKKMSPTYKPVDTVPTNVLTGSGDDGSNGITGQYFYKPNGGKSYVVLGSGTVSGPATIFVAGDLYIKGDITYGSWDPLNTTGGPYLSVIVSGNIIVDANVKRLDGLYVTQGDGTNSGIFATCNSQSSPSQIANAADLSVWCRQYQLVVNGAVIAQQVKLLRSLGSLDSAPDSNSERPGNSSTSAEVFNFAPSMLLIQPNLQTDAGAVTPGLLEGVFSLPPVF